MLDTPLVRNDKAQHETFDEKSAAALYASYAAQARKYFVGPMPPIDFVGKFLPKAAKVAPLCSRPFSTVPPEAKTEEQLYRPLVCFQFTEASSSAMTRGDVD